MTRGLTVYRVGGSVRDQLLGLPGQDRDWVVVGASTETMLQHGFRQVGADFPVFLHPHTREEYALARTERKSAPGYLGFDVDSSATVTLQQDLLRRDLTINAMACTAEGRIIDPYGGQEDLRRKILRHVSTAFAEDPVRVLRVARFAARFAPLQFTVHPTTLCLMQDMVAAGEVDHLVAERVWQETRRALTEAAPAQFFCVLTQCDAQERIFPEIDALYGVPQTRKYHPEIDSGTHTMLVLEATRCLSNDPEALFAALTHDLGKAVTPVAELPSHRGHEQRGLGLIEALCERLRVPRRFRQLALLVCRNHLMMHHLERLRSSTVLRLLESLQAFKQVQWVEQFACVCEADSRGRGAPSSSCYPQRQWLLQAWEAASAVDCGAIAAQQSSPSGIAAAIAAARVAAIDRVRQQWAIFQEVVRD